MSVTAEDSKLHVTVPGQGKMRLMAQGDHEFALEVDQEIRVTFEVSSGQAASLTLNAGGGGQTATRVK